MLNTDNEKILIVEDEEHLLKSLEVFLKNETKYQILNASNGKEALKVLDKHNIDLILTDLKMPEMDGIELLKYVQNKKLDIPVIVMTAYKSLETAIETIRLGGYDYMVKPYEFEMALITVNRAIEKARLTKKAKVAENLKTIAAASVTLNHEINNPLTGIMGNLELLLDDLPEEREEIKNGLKIALENSQRIADVVKKFQKISKFVTIEYVDHQLMLDLEKSSSTKTDKNEE